MVVGTLERESRPTGCFSRSAMQPAPTSSRGLSTVSAPSRAPAVVTRSASPLCRSTSRSWSTPVWSQNTGADGNNSCGGEVIQLRRAHELLDELETVWLGSSSNASKTSSTKPLGRNANDRLECRQERRGQDNGSSLREFKTSITNVWQLWADPRLLERWWGPPGFPTTFEHHDLTPGGTITYFMSGPDGGERFDGTGG